MDRFIIFYTGVFLVKWVSGWGNQPSGTERIGSIFFVTPVFLWTKLINVSGRNLFLKRSKVYVRPRHANESVTNPECLISHSFKHHTAISVMPFAQTLPRK
jgi:hypothetical protein